MGEEISLENGRMSDFHGLVTLTLTSDRVILHTVMHHSSTSTYIPNFIKIEETLYGWTDRRTDGHLRPTNVIRSTRRSRPKKWGDLRWIGVTQGQQQHNHLIERTRLPIRFNRNYEAILYCFWDIIAYFQKLERSRDSHQAPFRDSLSSVDWDLLW